SSSLALTALLALVLAAPAQAALIAAGSVDGGGRGFATDNDVTNTCGVPVVGPCQLPDTDAALGQLVLNAFNLAGGDLQVLVSVQTATLASGPGTLNRLDSTGTQVTNLGAVSHTFVGVVSATDFVGPVPG